MWSAEAILVNTQFLKGTWGETKMVDRRGRATEFVTEHHPSKVILLKGTKVTITKIHDGYALWSGNGVFAISYDDVKDINVLTEF